MILWIPIEDKSNAVFDFEGGNMYSANSSYNK